MPASKHVGRLIVCLLVLCLLFCLTPGQALAENDETTATPGQVVTLVRRSAYAGSTVIGCFEDGTRLKVLGSQNQFYRIDCYDMTGYILKSQVRKDENGVYYVNCVAGSSETTTLPTRTPDEALALRGDVRTEALKYQGVPYVWGGTTPKGFDCSGFTSYVYKKVGSPISRSCYYQLQCGVIVPRSDLQCGDLIFFENTGEDGGFASHVGIYIGNGQLIHAGSKGITVVYLDSAYFSYHYMCARRVVLTSTPELTPETVLPATGITQNINGSYWRESSQTTDESGNSFLSVFTLPGGAAAGAHRPVADTPPQWALPCTYTSTPAGSPDKTVPKAEIPA